MWRYEVLFINKEGIYQWKGFGTKEKFDKFLNKLVRNKIKIVGIHNMDGKTEADKYRAMYIK